jgi:Zn-dependent peptidase ImmA (M78 family)/transcriptional regulator with XRE-family HTH domain
MQIGGRIKSAILALGMTPARVAEKAGVPVKRLNSIIAGETPSTRELAGIAEALAVDPAALFRGDASADHSRSAARFRAPQGIQHLDADDTRLLSRAAEAGRICAYLRASIGKSDSLLGDLRGVRGVSPRPEPWRQGYELGRGAREEIAPERQPLHSVQQLLEDVGVHVAVVAFSTSDIEAASLYERDACPVILLNRKNSRIALPLSRRAVLAHELCHLLHDGGERDLTVVSREMSRDPIEQRANGFAPNFLAPTNWLNPKAKQPRKLVREIAEEWGLSFEGAAWHAKHHSLISDLQAEEFARRPEDVTVTCEPELPRTPPEQFGIDGVKTSPLVEGLLAETALLALLEGAISKGRAAEVLSLR